MEETLKLILDELRELKTDVNTLKEGQGRTEANVLSLKEGQDRNETMIHSLKEGQDRIESSLTNLIEEVRSNFKYTNEQLDEHRRILEVVADELSDVKMTLNSSM